LTAILRQEEPIAAAQSGSRLGLPGWLAIIALAGFLGGALVYAVHGWHALDGVAISPLGWLIMVLGTVVTLGVGGGLMALLFYSSRTGRDF
jgi:hypothetical protein